VKQVHASRLFVDTGLWSATCDNGNRNPNGQPRDRCSMTATFTRFFLHQKDQHGAGVFSPPVFFLLLKTTTKTLPPTPYLCPAHVQGGATWGRLSTLATVRWQRFHIWCSHALFKGCTDICSSSGGPSARGQNDQRQSRRLVHMHCPLCSKLVLHTMTISNDASLLVACPILVALKAKMS